MLKNCGVQSSDMTHYMARSGSADFNDWAHWISGTGPDGAIDIDNDGVMSNVAKLRIDLTQALSLRLGRQMSMMSTYRVNYIRLELRNVDDANDNDSGAQFHGQIHAWSPTKHRINAMQLARAIEKADGADEPGDMFGPLDNARTYSGMRFNWDSDSQVKFATGESFSVLTGTQWDLAELFNTYETSQVSYASDYDNALWTQGRCGQPNNLGFSVAYANKTQTEQLTDPGTQDSYDPRSDAYEFHGNLEVLGGLLMLEVTHSSVDDGDLTAIDDDYELFVTIGVEGWSDF